MGFASLALICAVALAGPLLSLPRWLHLPVVIGELFVGVIVGTTGFRVLDPTDATFHFLGEVGFALVMFVAGSHVPVRDPALRKGLMVGAARAVGVGVLAAPLGLVIAQLFGTGHGPLYAVIIASSSASLVMPVLGGIPTTAPAIVQMLPQLAIADAATIIALPLAADPAHAARASVGALLVLAAAAVLFAFLKFVYRTGGAGRVHEVSTEKALAIELRFTLAVLFALAAIATSMHVSVMLAGFAGGLVIAGVGEPTRLSAQVFALTEGFFGPIFFVWLGASLNLRELGPHPAAIGLGLALGCAAILAHTALAITKQPWPVSAITAAELGVPVAAATLLTSAGTQRPGEATALLLGALVTVALTAAIAGRVRAIAGADAKTAADQPR